MRVGAYVSVRVGAIEDVGGAVNVVGAAVGASVKEYESSPSAGGTSAAARSVCIMVMSCGSDLILGQANCSCCLRGRGPGSWRFFAHAGTRDGARRGE